MMSSVYRNIDANFALANTAAPIHPGALRYFRDIGPIKKGRKK